MSAATVTADTTATVSAANTAWIFKRKMAVMNRLTPDKQ